MSHTSTQSLKEDLLHESKIRVEFVVLMAALTSVMALSIDAILPAFKMIGSDLKLLDPNHIQYLISVLFFGFGVGLIIFGPISDTMGRKKPIYYGGIIFLIGTLIAYFSESLNIMLVGRFFQGFGAASFRIMAITIIRDEYSGKTMAKVMSFITTVFILVPIVAPSIGQAILFLAPWRSIFLFYLITCSVTISWFALRQRETLPEGERKKFSWSNLKSSFKETLTHPTSLFCILIVGLMRGGMVAYLSCSQQIFQGVYEVGEKFPLYFGSLALTIGLSNILNSRLLAYFGVGQLVKFALLILTFVLVPVTVYFYLGSVATPTLLSFMFLFGCFFGCLGLLFGNLTTMALDPLGHIAGSASSVVGFTQNLISVIIGMLISQQFDQTVRPVTTGLALISFFSLALFYIAIKNQYIKLKS